MLAPDANGRPSAAPTAVQQVTALVALVAEAAAAARSILAAATAPVYTDPPVVPIALASDGPATWVDGRQLLLVRALLSTDTTGRYTLQIGSDASRRFDLVASVPVEVVSPDGPVLVARGLPLTVTGPGGAVWDLAGWVRPQETGGTVDARQ